MHFCLVFGPLCQNRTIWQPDTFGPFKCRACLVVRWLLIVDFPHCRFYIVLCSIRFELPLFLDVLRGKDNICFWKPIIEGLCFRAMIYFKVVWYFLVPWARDSGNNYRSPKQPCFLFIFVQFLCSSCRHFWSDTYWTCKHFLICHFLTIFPVAGILAIRPPRLES